MLTHLEIGLIISTTILGADKAYRIIKGDKELRATKLKHKEAANGLLIAQRTLKERDEHISGLESKIR